MPIFDGDVLRARGLVKQYKRIRAVDGIDLKVGAGERVALLGPNGAGKTTTLLMLLGVVTPDSGWVEVAGHRLPRHRSAAAAHVGFAAGYLPLPERLRVREFLRLFGKLYGIHDPTPQVEAGLERFGITHLGDAMGNELSSGQRTLVGIVKAALHDPALLILDEPTASLDPDVALEGPHRAEPAVCRGRRRPARDEPQHGRGGAPVRPGGVHLAGEDRRRRPPR